MKGKSCLSQLLHAFHDWASERSKRETIDVIFMDLSKAFESVVHSRLLMKIKAYGITVEKFF
jgi:predicted O-methyltransferase YrrM